MEVGGTDPNQNVQTNTAVGNSTLQTPTEAANSIIAQARDSRTGNIDTRAIAHWVADARRTDPQAANEAFKAIETQLTASGNVGDLSRFYQDVRSEFSNINLQSPQNLERAGNTVFGVGQGLVEGGAGKAAAGARQLIDNPILRVRWEGSTSPITGRGGFSSNLENFLRRSGIDVAPRVNPVAPGSVTPRQLLASGQATTAREAIGRANNINGSAAEAAIRAREARPGVTVDPRPTRVQGGARVVDVTVHQPNAVDPRNSIRLEIESKVGRTHMGTSNVAREVANDAARLADNQAARRAGAALEASGNALRVAGKVLRPVGIALDAYAIGSAFHEDGNRVGVNTGRAISSTAGGLAGAAGGAAVGAAIGSAVPIIGTAVGGVVGGIIGGLGGSEIASRAFDRVRSWF
jgi:trimeric autotransporter adhesin